MKVKLKISTLRYGDKQTVVEIQSNVSEDDIKTLFPIKFGVFFDDNICSYEILKE